MVDDPPVGVRPLPDGTRLGGGQRGEGIPESGRAAVRAGPRDRAGPGIGVGRAARGNARAVTVVFALDPRRVAYVLGTIALVVVLVGALGDAARYLPHQDQSLARVGRVLRAGFGPSREQTVGTWYAASLLLLCAGLLLLVASAERARGDRVGHWRGLAAIFLFLSCDEAIAIHERLGDEVERWFVGDGFLRWEWVIPYAAFALLVAVIYLPFVARLPARTRRLFVVAGALYVGGALGLETVQAQVATSFGAGTVTNTILASVEEAAELAGAIVFAFALLSHLAAVVAGRQDGTG